MAAADLTAQLLRELLNYNPETGLFTWRVRRNISLVGSIAGTLHHDGYIQINALGRFYGAHRLAWLHTNGEFPDGDIDHKDGCRSNNSISNLRDVSRSVNIQNQQRPRADNTNGFLGVSWNTRSKKWYARIQIKGKQKNLGYFDTPEKAHDAYLTAKRVLHDGCTI